MGTSEHIFKNIRVYWLAFVVYWGIILFGYDTGIAGGVVGAPFFVQSFGLQNSNGTLDTKKSNAISSNVVSVLQAGAFFGALGSAPISAKIGRRITLLAFSAIFLLGAILTTVANGGSKGLAEIYAGRVIIGVGIGGISAVSPAFVSECSPKEVRGRITGLFQVFVAIGVMMSYWVNYGIQVHIPNGPKFWKIPFGVQLIPAGIMCFGLLTLKESPRWLASVGRTEEAIRNLAYLRKEPESSEAVIHEMAEIEAAIQEEREARQGLGLREAFFGKGNFVRFVIAFVIFFLQQWSGQNSVNYYSPQIFASIGYTARRNGLLATGVYGVVKVVATCLFIFFGVEWLGRKASLAISAFGMGTCFFIIGAILKTHPPPATGANSVVANPPPASKAMAAMLYIYVCFYSMGWGPLPWVYCADIFPTRTRHYGMAVASASQWLWNFTLTKTTPQMVTALGYKIFLMFATINIAGMGVFSLIIPETKGRSLEDMDIIFGAVTQEKREAGIAKQERVLDQQHHEDEASDGDEKV
ncbi:general substrate transporter [Mycena pura]|uniref:General substrate transporter n=1 Tax=Mycena pura TaxID=153505 RepID=A0AAD6VMD9_9AGAR|nr:general substrate transporter [Mycena pura]